VNPFFLNHWNLSLQEVAPMDFNGAYWVDLPYGIGYEGREACELSLSFSYGFFQTWELMKSNSMENAA